MANYYSLHNHTEYSNIRLIDSTNKIPSLIDKAIEYGFKGLAITDHETISGHVTALKYMEKKKVPNDFKLILGNEIYLINGNAEDLKENYKPGMGSLFYHYILLALDDIGHEQIRLLSSMAWDNYFRTGKMERVPCEKKQVEKVIGINPGHVVASTACLGGELPKMILELLESENEEHQYGIKCKIDDFIQWNISMFGKENFFLEMQPGISEEQKQVNKFLLKLSTVYDIDYIITTDSHYLTKDHQKVHEAYLQSKEEEREVASFYSTTYLMSEEEMYAYMDYFPKEVIKKGIENTGKIGERVEEYNLQCSTIVPAADVPSFEVAHYFKEYYDSYPILLTYAESENIYDRYLLYLIEKGYDKKIKHAKVVRNSYTEKEMIERIATELEEMLLVTEKIHQSISSYYISTLELIDIMWNEGDSLVGIARGSVTGMFTMYLIDLIQMNPLDWGLPHWRHISHEKAELSDVDIDSQKNRREKIIQAVKDRKGENRVLNCCTFKTEGSKSSVITACRALGISPDVSIYLSSMIPVTRGQTWSLHDCIYGNVEKERKPVPGFEKEMRTYDDLLEISMGIEGLISGRSIHASAVYVFNEDYVKHNARMKAPNGVSITQFNMNDSDYCGGLKMDFLTIEALDKIRLTMEQLIEAGYMTWQGSLRETYDTYLHPDVLDYDTKEMWDFVAENKVVDLFQFDTETGLQAAKRIQPHSLEELAAANSIMRLMVTEQGAEQPMDTYIRFKNDISQWYQLMRAKYHLTEDEIVIMEKYLKTVYGVGDTQEIVMEISMDEKVANFNVSESNKLRKGIAKKKEALQKEMKEMFFKKGKDIGTSDNLLNYVWNEVVGKQLGYSFSKNHTFPYSAIGLQELNLAYHYPIIYWNTACLTINAGADQDTLGSKQSTDYGKIAKSIAQMQKRGITIAYPSINEAQYNFVADEKNNKILFALKSISGIGDDVVEVIIENRPYNSMEDFFERMVDTKLITQAKMIQLIKAGCFDEFMDRQGLLKRFIQEYKCKFIEKLTLSQMMRLQEMNQNYPELHLIPKDKELAIQIYNFYKYVRALPVKEHYVDPHKKRIPKCGYHDEIIELDGRAMIFFLAHYTEQSIYSIRGDYYSIRKKVFEKESKEKMQPLLDYLLSPETIEKYNRGLYIEQAEKIVTGNNAHMEMESLCVYISPHELHDLDYEKYNLVNFFELDEDPPIHSYYYRTIKKEEGNREIEEKKKFPKYEIVKICGTVLETIKEKHSLTLLTPEGVVTVKYPQGEFLHYYKELPNDASWFKRGNMLMITGYRQGDVFRCRNYADTIFKHSTALINIVSESGDIVDVSTTR